MEKQWFTISVYSENTVGLLNRISGIFIVGQIEKQIEVIKAFYHIDDETIYQESALFKIASDLLFDERQIQNIIKESNSQIVTVAREFFVLAKSGRRHEIDEMHDQLKPFGIMQFVRSGRISVSKDEMKISTMLQEFQPN